MTTEKVFVDFSVIYSPNHKAVLKKYVEEGKQLVISQFLIEKFDTWLSFENNLSRACQDFLTHAAEHPDVYCVEIIDEKYDTEDECTLNYCIDNNTSLLSANSTLVLRARMKQVEAEYLSPDSSIEDFIHLKYKTLFQARKINSKLIIESSSNTYRTTHIAVLSKGCLYTQGPFELDIGDDVYIVSRKDDYISFSHFIIFSLFTENNAEFIFSKRFYSCKDINSMQNSETYGTVFSELISKFDNLV